jgi:hypothetical protein
MMRTFFHAGRGVRTRTWIAAGALAALGACGIAAADSDLSGATLASATFYANTLSGSASSQTCTTSNSNSIQVTDATFTGTASSTTDPSLNGPLTIKVRSVYDSTTNAGSLWASFSVTNSSVSPPASFNGQLTAVDDNGSVQGLLSGYQGGGVQLLGNVTASFSSTGGFSSSGSPGSIGSGTGTNTAIVSSGTCSAQVTNPPTPPPLPHPIKPLPYLPLGFFHHGHRHHNG